MNTDFTGQTILVIGLAREGAVACRWLARKGAHVIASDVRHPDALKSVVRDLSTLPIRFHFGPQTPDLLAGIDGLVISPGVPQDIPILQEARKLRLPLSSETRLFAQRCPAPILGITGSSGKTTTSTLTAEILKASKLTTWLGGNIGTPLLADLSHIQSDNRVVMELSSFQLIYWAQQEETTTRPWHDPHGLSPQISAILNITPNHLDRHPSMAHYIAAKAQILAYQTSQDFTVLNLDDPLLASWAQTREVQIKAGPGQQAWHFPLAAAPLTFSLTRPPLDQGAWLDHDRLTLRWQDREHVLATSDQVRLRGRHNLANILAAICLSAAAGASPVAQSEVIRNFSGVEHRLEEVRRHRGVLWINDSIATSPERAIAALLSFDQPLILLAGGRDKHLPWDAWAATVHQRVRQVITFGEAAPLINSVLSPIPSDSHLQAVHHAQNLTEAVELAASLAQEGDIVLLSPGGTSFDAYQDFAARGRHFRKLVNTL